MSVYKFLPVAVAKPWGGGHLDQFSNDKSLIGELVLVSDLDTFKVSVQAINQEKAPILPFAQFYQNYLTQNQKPGSPFPFMIKLLSTGEPLSVQNHPADEDLPALGLTGHGKFESWAILDAEKEARVYLGLKKEYQKEILLQLETLAEPLGAMNEFTPASGQIFLLSPGLIHATKGKLMFYEIQQSSDHTFRIYDFGRGRSLDLEKALKVFRNPDVEIRSQDKPLQTPAFNLTFESADDKYLHVCSHDFEILTWLGNQADMRHADKTISLQWADTFFLTKGSELEIRSKFAPQQSTKNKVFIAYE